MIRNLKKYPKDPLVPGGMNDTDDQLTLPPGVLVNLLNMEFERKGIKTRPGYADYSTSGLPVDKAVLGGYAFKKKDGNKYLLIDAGTDIYLEGAVGVFSSVKSGLTEGYFGNYTTLANLAIRMDGQNTPLKYDGTNYLSLGITAPSTGPGVVAVAPAASGITGTFKYKITFVSSSGAETNPGPASAAVSPSSEDVDLSSIATGTAEVVKRKIYRTTDGGSVYYLLATISDNTTTVYTDATSDVALSTDLAPTNHDNPPSSANHPEVYKEFLFVTDPDFPTRSYFCHQSFPEIFSTAEGTGYYLETGLNDGQDVIGRKTLRDILYVFKENSTWPVAGGSPDDFKTTIEPISNSKGLYHRSMAIVDFGRGDMIVGLAEDGFFAFDGYTFKDLGVQEEVGIDITGFIDGLDKNALDTAWGFNDTGKKQYRCFVRESGQSANNKELVWDYKRNKITIFDRAGNVVIKWNNAMLFGASSADGKVYNIGGLNDAGSAISIEAEFPWWNVGMEVFARFCFLNVYATLQGNYSPTITAYVDESNISIPLDLYTAAVTTSSASTTFAATTVTDGTAWDLSEVVVGMFAVASGGSYGIITAIDDGSDQLTCANGWVGGTPVNGETVEVRGSSWGSVAFNTDGGTYRVMKQLDIVGSDEVRLEGQNIKFKLTHAGLNQPVTLHDMKLLHQFKRKLVRN